MSPRKTHKYHDELLKELQSHAKEVSELQREKAKRYIGTSKRLYFVETDTTRRLVKEWLREHPELSSDDYAELLTSLYRGESCNEISIAGELLRLAPKLRRHVEPRLLDTWLNSVEGWAETDSICQSSFSAEELLARWTEWKSLLVRLVSDGNVHKRRASLVLLTKPVRDSENKRLADLAFANIDRLKNERSILVTKAISWLLRDLIRHHRERMETYLFENSDCLPKIAIRETRRKLLTGKK